MTTMKVRFVKDTPPIPQTGNEHYHPGMDADLRDSYAEWLIEQGYAEPFDHVGVPGDLPPVDEPTTVDYASMSLSELRRQAREAGVYKAKMRKADLIAALEGNQS